MRRPYIKLLFGVLFSGGKTARQLAWMAAVALSLATRYGDLEHGWLAVGQVTGLGSDIPAVNEFMERMVARAKTFSAKVSQQTFR